MFAALMSASSPRLSQWLASQGVSQAGHLVSLFSKDEWDSGEAIQTLGTEMGLDDQDEMLHIGEELRGLVESLRGEAHRDNQAFAHKPIWEITAQAQLKRMHDEEERIEKRLRSSSWVAKRATAPPPALRPRHATCRRRAVAGAGDSDGRARAELQERKRWIGELVKILETMEAPCIQEAQASTDPERAIKLLVGGRRVTTLRARVREWRKAALWLRGTTGSTFFATSSNMMDFLCDRFDQSGTKSAIQSAFAAIRFMEDLMGIPMAERLSGSALVSNARKELMTQATTRRDGATHKQAQPPRPKLYV